MFFIKTQAESRAHHICPEARGRHHSPTHNQPESVTHSHTQEKERKLTRRECIGKYRAARQQELASSTWRMLHDRQAAQIRDACVALLLTRTLLWSKHWPSQPAHAGALSFLTVCLFAVRVQTDSPLTEWSFRWLFFLPLNLAGPVSSRQTPHWRGTVAGGKLPCSQSARPNALTGLGSGLCRPFSLEAYRLQFVYYACHVIIAPRPLIDDQIDRVRRTGLRPGPVSRG